jgi:hypothetical protein
VAGEVAYPPLLIYATEEEYRMHFESVYCQNHVVTFDGIQVNFYSVHFRHAFYESARRQEGDKSVFSRSRAERLDWIKVALQDPKAELYWGYDSRKKRVNKARRVCIVLGDYVVVVGLKGAKRAFFITAFVADSPRTLAGIRSSPRWQP